MVETNANDTDHRVSIASKLPQELIDKINAALCSPSVSSPLRAASLISHAWYPSSRTYFFRCIGVFESQFSRFDRLLRDSPHFGGCVKVLRTAPKTQSQRELFSSICRKLGNVEDLAFFCQVRELPPAESVCKIGPVKKLSFEVISDTWDFLTLAAYLDAFPLIEDLTFTIYHYPQDQADSPEDLKTFGDALSKLRLKHLDTDGNACEILAPCLLAKPQEMVQELDIEIRDLHLEWLPVSCVIDTTKHSLKRLSITISRQRWDDPVLPTLTSDLQFPKLTHMMLKAKVSNSKFVIALLPFIEAPQLQELSLELRFFNDGMPELSYLTLLRERLTHMYYNFRLQHISIKIEALVLPQTAWEYYKQSIFALFVPLQSMNVLRLDLRYLSSWENEYYEDR